MSNPNGPRRNPANTGGPPSSGNAGNGSSGNGKHARARPTRPAEPNPADFWRIPPKMAAPAPVTPAADPSALLRSLGRPPLDQVGADRYLAAVAERAAGLATALAVAAGILADRPDD